jgi:hypothetical protein
MLAVLELFSLYQMAAQKSTPQCSQNNTPYVVYFIHILVRLGPRGTATRRERSRRRTFGQMVRPSFDMYKTHKLICVVLCI